MTNLILPLALEVTGLALIVGDRTVTIIVGVILIVAAVVMYKITWQTSDAHPQ